jgi:hypothetical protein
MAKKYKSKHLHDDFEVIRAIKYCFDRGIYFTPKVIPGQTHAMKFVPKVNITRVIAGVETTGKVEYDQGDELYDIICDLYMHRYSQMNEKSNEFINKTQQK